MPTISQIQLARTLQVVARKFYQSGITPDLYQIMSKVSSYFAQNPPGTPVVMDINKINNSTIPANVDNLNAILANLYTNLAVLYDTSIVQTNELLQENKTLTNRIKRISDRQQRLLTQVDDYLFSLYNTGGYYFSISDNFSDTSKSDLTFTTSFIDTVNHEVTIPLLGSGLSTIVPNTLINAPTVQATDGSGNTLNYTTISPFNFAINGANNTLWEIQISQNNPSPVEVEVIIPFQLSTGQQIDLSRIDFDPYSIIPFQLYALIGTHDMTNSTIADYQSFGNSIITSPTKITFTGSVKNAISVKFVMNKTAEQYDFQTSSNGTLQYVYIFGAKEIVFSQQIYDNNAFFVSSPLSMLNSSSNVIDAVALEVIDTVPVGTNIEYFVAPDNPQAQYITDFQWQNILPSNPKGQANIVRFNGAYSNRVFIRSIPRSSTDLQLIPIKAIANNPTQLNPNPVIVPGADIYTLANFSDTFLTNSISLEEGVNSTRIYYITGNDQPEDVSFWANVINNNEPQPSLAYGEIDIGNGFFYGGSLSSDPAVVLNNQDITLYIETYLYLDEPLAPIVDTFTKLDLASKTWDVNIYLNGELLAFLPGRNAGNNTLTNKSGQITPLDSALLTWNFQEGINHIFLIVYIPKATEINNVVPAPYLGTIEALQNNPIYKLGTVKLANWSYLSFFDLEYNQPGTPKSFTIYNNQIISRHQPTTNFRLNYAQNSGLGPSAIRFKADLSRSVQNEILTPQLGKYSLRFLYGI